MQQMNIDKYIDADVNTYNIDGRCSGGSRIDINSLM